MKTPLDEMMFSARRALEDAADHTHRAKAIAAAAATEGTAAGPPSTGSPARRPRLSAGVVAGTSVVRAAQWFTEEWS